jgi:type II secretory pathway pseudopilin PulG
MSNRPAVTLIEVMVATVLLAVGVAGTVAALVAATRLRLEAAARETAAATADRRLAWFEAMGCLGGDTAIVALPPGAERWTLERDTLSATLDGRAEHLVGSRAVRVPLRVRRECR